VGVLIVFISVYSEHGQNKNKTQQIVIMHIHILLLQSGREIFYNLYTQAYVVIHTLTIPYTLHSARIKTI